MNKQRIFLLIAGFIALIVTVLYFFRFPFRSVSPFEAVPNTSAVVLEFSRADSLLAQLKKTEFDKKFSNFYPVQHLQKDYETLQSIFNASPDVRQSELLFRTQTLAALQVNASDDANFLYILNLDNQQFELDKWLKKLTNYRIESYRYANENVYQVTENNKSEAAFSFATYRGLLLAGRFPLLVEDAIAQLQKLPSNITRSGDFRAVRQPNSKSAECHIYVNINNLSSLFSTWVQPEKMDFIASLSQFTSWVSLRLNFKNHKIELSGKAAGLEGFLANIGSKTPTNRTEMEAIMPNNTAFFSWFDVSSMSRFLNKIDKKCPNFQTYLAPYTDGQGSFALTEPYSDNLAASQFLIFKIKDEKTVLKSLSDCQKQYKNANIYDYQMFKIYSLPDTAFLPSLSGIKTASQETLFYTIIDGFIIFADTQISLELWLDKFIAGQTLASDPYYLDFLSCQTSKNTNFSCYFNTNYLQKFVTNLAKNEKQNAVAEQFNLLQQLGRFAFQISSDGSKLSFVGLSKIGKNSVTASEKKEKNISIAWKTTLLFEAANTPTIIKNPLNNSTQIMVQDTAGNLYSCNESGEILWQKPLRGKILSPIYSLDYYGNGQNYILFNTPKQIYLLDNQGNNAATFPVKLQSPATNGLMLTDFDGTKEYCFFVACQNKNIYGFSKIGRPLEGWNPLSNAGIVTLPIRHFQKDGKDFVTFINNSGEWQCYKRDGTRRWETKKITATSYSPLDYQMDTQFSRVVLGDDKGKIYVTNPDGATFNLGFKVGTNTKTKFIFGDIFGDARKDYILLSNSSLACFYYKNTAIVNLFEYTFSAPQDEVFAVQSHNNQKQQIGVLCKSKSQISLLDDVGAPLTGFPLAGTTSFVLADLLKDGSEMLIVGNGSSLCAYRIR